MKRNKWSLGGIKLTNFRNIDKFEINFLTKTNDIEMDIENNFMNYVLDKKWATPSFVALLGRNAIGKTNIIYSLWFMRNLASDFLEHEALQQFVVENLKKKEDDNMSLEQSKELLDFSFGKIKKIIDPYLVSQIEVKKNELIKKTIYSNSKDQAAPIEIEIKLVSDSSEAYISLVALNSIFNIEYRGIDEKEGIDFLERMTYNDPVLESKNDTNSHLKLLIGLIGESKTLALIQLADPSISKIFITKENNKSYIELLSEGNKVNASQLSDGTRKFISLASTIVHSNSLSSSICLIDEIELYMHFELIHTLKIMMAMANKINGCQFIFTTHNPLVIDNFMSFKQAYSIEKEDEQLKYNKVSTMIDPRANFVKKFSEGLFSMYPNPDRARNVAIDVMFVTGDD